MPRFFIHIRSNGHCRSYDEDGLDFPNVETARKEVLRAAQDLISVFAARDQDPRDHAVEIENEAGEVVLRLPFSEIFLHLRSEPRAYRSC
jgi:Tfp pilus assembly ATPase PilU